MTSPPDASDDDCIIVLDDEDDDPSPAAADAAPLRQRSRGPDAPPTPPPPLNSSAGEKGLRAENERLFQEFVAFCSRHTKDDPEFISYLSGCHQRTSPEYLASVEFHNVLSRCLTQVQGRSGKIYVCINEFCTAFRAHSQRRRAVTPGPANTQDAPAALASQTPSEPAKPCVGSKQQIRYLENLLRVYANEIRQLQEQELDFEELDSQLSAYLQESLLMGRLMHVFKRLCQLRDCSSLTGRVIEQRISYCGTRYPEVNLCIEELINQPEAFPDFADILKVVQEASDRHSLGLPKDQMEAMAADAFRDVNAQLQEQRRLDLVYNFGSHPTDQYQTSQERGGAAGGEAPQVGQQRPPAQQGRGGGVSLPGGVRLGNSRQRGQGRRGLGPQPRRERRHRPKAPGAALNTTEQHSARKRERLTRALTQELVQSPVSPNQSYGGTCSTYNLSCTDARCQDSAPIRMFASFHPLANTTGALSGNVGAPLEPCVAAAPSAAEQQSPERPAPAFLPCPTPPLKRQAPPPVPCRAPCPLHPGQQQLLWGDGPTCTEGGCPHPGPVHHHGRQRPVPGGVGRVRHVPGPPRSHKRRSPTFHRREGSRERDPGRRTPPPVE